MVAKQLNWAWTLSDFKMSLSHQPQGNITGFSIHVGWLYPFKTHKDASPFSFLLDPISSFPTSELPQEFQFLPFPEGQFPQPSSSRIHLRLTITNRSLPRCSLELRTCSSEKSPSLERILTLEQFTSISNLLF